MLFSSTHKRSSQVCHLGGASAAPYLASASNRDTLSKWFQKLMKSDGDVKAERGKEVYPIGFWSFLSRARAHLTCADLTPHLCENEAQKRPPAEGVTLLALTPEDR
ncbi:uncharacterized [Tachysurus ichikawai]